MKEASKIQTAFTKKRRYKQLQSILLKQKPAPYFSSSGEILEWPESGVGVGNSGKVGVGDGVGYFTSDPATLISTAMSET